MGKYGSKRSSLSNYGFAIEGHSGFSVFGILSFNYFYLLFASNLLTYTQKFNIYFAILLSFLQDINSFE